MDIYFRHEYGELCEIIEEGICECFEVENEYGRIRNLFIKRKIPYLINGVQFYDISTPYGYGGPVILDGEKRNQIKLIDMFNDKFTLYCKENNIVSEFVRFHPLYNNAVIFEHIYHPECIRKTVGTDLLVENPFQTEFSKKCRKNIRRAMNAGVSYRVAYQPNDISVFMEIYYSTMKRDCAEKFYYFSKNYFDTLLKKFKNDIILVEAVFEEKVIAANLCFVSDKKIHIHLSGTLSEYLYLSPAYILRYATVEWGIKHGMELVHHGGGVTNADDDSLFLFKKQFAVNNSYDYYIGKRIYNKRIYDKLCELAETQDSTFFPAYRKR